MEKPIYNEDFSQMTVKLREGIYWSDGVEFTADDLIYTVDVQKNTPGFAFTGQFARYVDSMDKPDDYTVVFNLTEGNSRFHAVFTVRRNACFIIMISRFRCSCAGCRLEPLGEPAAGSNCWALDPGVEVRRSAEM